jgi:hypothetical protein
MMREPELNTVIVQRFTDALNKQDMDAAMACVSASVVTASYGGSTETVGMRALEAALEQHFAEKPKKKLSIQGRFLATDKVVQNESYGAGLGAGDKRVAIYWIAGELISRIDYMR